MDKFRYGTKEIIATVLGVLLMAIAKYVQLATAGAGIVDAQLYGWITPTVPVVAIASVFFGPVTGLLCGVGGELLISEVFSSAVNYPEMLSEGVYGFFVGLYFGKMHFDHRVFSTTKFFDFNAVQIMTGIFCGMFLLPVMNFILEKENLYESVIAVAKVTLGATLLVGVVGSFVMLMVSIFTGSDRRGRRS